MVNLKYFLLSELRHTNKETNPPPQLVTEVTVPVKTTIKVMKSVVKNPSAKVKTKRTLNKDSSKSKDGIVNPTPSLPVSLTLEAGMSISDSKVKLPSNIQNQGKNSKI